MKSPAAKPGSTAATPKAPVESAVNEELQLIDTSPLDRLLEIRKEATRL